MSLVSQCDRCGFVSDGLVPRGSADLCAGCDALFAQWLATGRAMHSTRGKLRLRQVRAICEVHGHATADLLAEASGLTRKQAARYLAVTASADRVGLSSTRDELTGALRYVLAGVGQDVGGGE